MEDRLTECPYDDACEMQKIEVDFAIPVFMTQEQQRRLYELITDIVKSPWNQFHEGVHWLAGVGSRPNFSQADAVFLGKPVDPNTPASGEPTFDDSVFHMETCARPFVSEKERERVLRERKV